MQHKKLTIGLFGFGVVGEGVYKVLQQSPSLQATIKKVCIRNPNKKRNAPDDLFTTDKELLLEDPAINIIVEVIDDADAAYKIVRSALLNGKAVVSASKKMIAEHLTALLSLQESTGLPFLYEAAACASIPVIRNLEEYYDNDLLRSIRAIVNGSTNYILTKIFEEQLSFRDALLQAKQLGFAESDPTLDIEGFDAVNKWILMLAHAYGIISNQRDIVFDGITRITLSDSQVAIQKGYSIKLIAQATKLQNGKVATYVLPQFVTMNDPLSFTKNEYNGVVLESAFADKQFFYGKGAGSFPTASAVLSDIGALRYDYRYEYKKLYHQTPNELTNDFYVRTYLSFDEWADVPHEEFESIEEWHANNERKYLVGILNFKKLRDGDWWKAPNVSLILMPDPVIESMDIINIKKKSLELGTNRHR